jgi:hypothetical protein
MAEEPRIQWRETTNILFEEVLPTEYKEKADEAISQVVAGCANLKSEPICCSVCFRWARYEQHPTSRPCCGVTYR